MVNNLVIIGASGFIGQQLLQKALSDESISTITVLVRKSLPIAHSKLEQKLVDFSNEEQVREAIPEDAAICCAIGTTMKNVQGNRDMYRKVDFDIPVLTATIGATKNASTYILVSAVGANASASNFYSRLKGETEEALKAIPLKSLHILQPSLLMGNRTEKRTGERVAQLVMPVFSFLLPDKYKPVEGTVVAGSMLQLAKHPTNGIHYHWHQSMINLSKLA